MSSWKHTVLVTGGAGFIGSNFIHFLREARPQWRIVNLDALTYAGNRENLADLAGDDGYIFIHGDVRDREVVDRAMKDCDGVVHFAAESHVDRSIHDSQPFVSTNVVGTGVVCDAARDHGGITKFVHIGTDEVYGSLPLDRRDLTFTEMTPLRPNSPYSASKAASDLLALSYHETFQLPVNVTRCSNNFGPYQFPEKVIPAFTTTLIDGGKVPLYGDGLNVRDWLHVIDHCEAVLRVYEDAPAGEVYNIGGNNERSNLELTRTILDIMGLDEASIEYVKDRPGHDRRYAIDAGKLRDQLGWEPTRSAWPSALEATLDWYRANEDWWRPLKEHTFNATMLKA